MPRVLDTKLREYHGLNGTNTVPLSLGEQVLTVRDRPQDLLSCDALACANALPRRAYNPHMESHDHQCASRISEPIGSTTRVAYHHGR